MHTLTRTLRSAGTGLRVLLVLTVLLGFCYPLALTALGLLMPDRAAGSLVRDASGQVVGSSLIGQDFSADETLFQSRPSAAGDDGYDGLSSGASNLGPDSPELATAIEQRRAAIAARESVPADRVPADALTASGSGLDPHISPAYAELQTPRVAARSGMSEEAVRSLVAAHTAGPALGFIGSERVDVLGLNLALKENRGS